MTFIPSSPATADEAPPINNHPFFPAVELAEFRSTMRVDNVATAQRARHALYTAMLDVNGRLTDWMLDQLSNGYETLASVPERPGQPPGARAARYLLAVDKRDMASPTERNSVDDTSGQGNNRADDLTENIDDLRRAASWAITDITGRPRSTVELIGRK